MGTIKIKVLCRCHILIQWLLKQSLWILAILGKHQWEWILTILNGLQLYNNKFTSCYLRGRLIISFTLSLHINSTHVRSFTFIFKFQFFSLSSSLSFWDERDCTLILCFGFRDISTVDLLDWFVTNLITFYSNFLMFDLFYWLEILDLCNAQDIKKNFCQTFGKYKNFIINKIYIKIA